MKQIEVENVTKVTKYEAIDGTIFSTKEECIKYEESAKCVLVSKYKSLIVKETTESTLYKVGSDERIDVIKINEEKDIDAVMQLYYYYNNSNYALEQGERMIKSCLKALSEKDYLIIYRGYEGEDSFWIRSTIGELITHIREFCCTTN